MIEKVGFMSLLIIFSVFILPFGLEYYVENVKTSKLLNASSEFQQLMVAEGDITPTVKHVVNDLAGKGLKITFKNEQGVEINQRAAIGQKVITTYDYDGIVTNNSTVLTRR